MSATTEGWQTLAAQSEEEEPRLEWLSPKEMLTHVGEPSYLVHGLVRAEGVTMWSALPDNGKTYALVDLACHIAAGLDSWHGQALFPGSGRVAFLVGEDAASWAGRIESWKESHPKHAPEVERNVVGLLPTNLHLGEEASPAALIESLSGKAEGPPALWVVDPLTSFLLDLEENDARQARAVMHNLGTLASRSKAPVLVAAHTARRGGGGPKGAVEFSGMASHLVELKKAKGLVTLDATKDRLGVDAPTSLSLRLTAPGLLERATEAEAKALERTPKATAPTRKDKVLEHVKAHPGQRAKEIATALRAEPPTVSNKLSRLKGKRLAHNVDGKWFPGPEAPT